MADFTENASPALLGIVQPVVGRKEAGIDAVVKRERFVNLAQKILETNGERSKTAIKADHEDRAVGERRRFVGGDDFAQLRFMEAEWLFAENVLAGVERGGYLAGMEMVARGDDHRVHAGMVEDLVFIGGTGSEAKFVSGVAGVRSVGRAGHNHLRSGDSLDRWKKRAGSEVSGSKQADAKGWIRFVFAF